MHKLLREPLLHFLLLGAGLFVLYGWVGSRGGGADGQVRITGGRVAHLVAGFEGIHQRPPEAHELEGLIEEAIREEIFYREAKALGLDQDDTIVRRRLMQKLEFVSEDVVQVPEPSDAQLLEYLQANPDRFRAETRYSLQQVYFNPQRHGPRLADDIASVLSELQQAGAMADASGIGDPMLLEHRLGDVTASEVVRLFGARFEAALRTMPTQAWQGPVSSGYGVHLVRIDRRDDGRAAALRDVRSEVRREWIYDQRKQLNERFYAELRKRYEVTVERPARGGGASGRVAGIRQ
ncbi:peptidyl-prolyl cis-trans isomerase [Lysobacter niastensis]|uniref:peptidylprolyl isomerase n=1 Tax=Lysobacter niastensis TaxID=380629 RepID=A0ABS0B8G8_9GAMM|nr:peptidylprolyl isomerase [Lysobacter niastensis]MBF6024022.1 peptidyl-prolyl cis-trans isomerase [Lysobacter niastensis]